MGKLFVANYKMNGNKDFFHSVNTLNKIRLKDTKLILCPPFVYLPNLRPKRFSLGAQDVCEVVDKKSTGEISVDMLTDLNVQYVIVGHSERRKMGETDKLIANKTRLALEYNIVPIVCVGEEKFRSNIDNIKEQVKIILENTDREVIFAYEPIWAIGTGKVPTINKINKVIALIKSIANEYDRKCQVLYGGSVNLQNYRELLKSDADGFLVGGLSLKLDDFINVLKGVDE